MRQNLSFARLIMTQTCRYETSIVYECRKLSIFSKQMKQKTWLSTFIFRTLRIWQRISRPPGIWCKFCEHVFWRNKDSKLFFKVYESHWMLMPKSKQFKQCVIILFSRFVWKQAVKSLSDIPTLRLIQKSAFS